MSTSTSTALPLRPGTPSSPLSNSTTNTTNTPSSPSSPTSPPWLPLLKTHISTMPSPEFTLATIHPPDGKSKTYPTPRLRTMIYRGMFAELPENKHNGLWGRLNPGGRIARETKKGGGKCGGEHEQLGNKYTSSMLTFTTDKRMEKAREMITNPGASTAAAAETPGAPVELLFWLRDPKIQTQWRIRGMCYFVSFRPRNPIAIENQEKIEKLLVRHIHPATCQDAAEVQPFSVQHEVLAHFSNLSPSMRGSFANPHPRSPISSNPDGLSLGTKISEEEIRSSARNDEGSKGGACGSALENFLVGVVRVDEVDRVDLGAKGGLGRRWVYSRVEGNGGEEGSTKENKEEGIGKEGGKIVNGWEVVETWP